MIRISIEQEEYNQKDAKVIRDYLQSSLKLGQ